MHCFLSEFSCIKKQVSALIIHLFGFEIICLFEPAEVLPFVSSFLRLQLTLQNFSSGEKSLGERINLANNAII